MSHLRKWLGPAFALVGLALAAWLFLHDRPHAIVTALHEAGAGLILAGLLHVLPMLANARDWQSILLRRPQPSLSTMLRIVWLRESVNSLLPVARIGGEIVSYRMLRAVGVRASCAIASLVADMQLTLISQLMFTLLALAYLLVHATSASARLAGDVLWGTVLLAPLLAAFCIVQFARPFARIGEVVNRATSGKLTALLGRSGSIDLAVRAIWRRRAVILRYLLLWQPVQCLATALELQVALHFLGCDIGPVKAVVLESLIQAVSSAAFFIPGGLGAQEAGFVIIGGALGIPPHLALALAAARRVRDVVIFVPGLLAWQWFERRTPARIQEVRQVPSA